jgi:biofilm PGA synthesis N-glycosyltransferase PgaC
MMPNNNIKELAVLIPAYNESDIIENTIKALRKILPAGDIYIVDDGSNDGTADIANKIVKNVVCTPNHGKAHALNFGIKHFELTKKYKYILFMDADTYPDKNFLKFTYKNFRCDRYRRIACVVGRVKGFGTNWITRYRQWEYLISHYVHKRAQSNLGSILVAPGCATVYRSSVFDKLKFPSGTLTEDMDFTFQLHRSGFKKIIFEDKAIVYTQDPKTLKDFIKQLHRWYTGFWQVVKKHDIPWQGQILDLEVSVLALEGLYNGLIVILFLSSFLPLYFMGKLIIFATPVLIDFFIFFIPTLIWSSFIDKDYLRLIYIPHFYFLRIISCLIFLEGFYRGFLSPEKEYIWNTRRYDQIITKGEIN